MTATNATRTPVLTTAAELAQALGRLLEPVRAALDLAETTEPGVVVTLPADLAERIGLERGGCPRADGSSAP